MKNMAYIVAILVGYFLGCSNMAYYLAKLKGADLRSAGSGNLGASNATILLGWGAGVATGVHDVAKSAIAVLLTAILFPEAEFAPFVAGVASVLGHIFPFYLKFRGGKGFASFWGMTLALNWKLALVVGAAIVIITWISDYIVLGTFATIVSVPLYVGLTGNWIAALIITVATLMILYKHRENIVRLIQKKEIGLRSAIRGDNKLDKSKE